MSCVHEWESTSEKSLCGWCGAAGYILEKKSSFEKFVEKLKDKKFLQERIKNNGLLPRKEEMNILEIVKSPIDQSEIDFELRNFIKERIKKKRLRDYIVNMFEEKERCGLFPSSLEVSADVFSMMRIYLHGSTKCETSADKLKDGIVGEIFGVQVIILPGPSHGICKVIVKEDFELKDGGIRELPCGCSYEYLVVLGNRESCSYCGTRFDVDDRRLGIKTKKDE